MLLVPPQFPVQRANKALQGKVGPDMSFTELKPYLKDIQGIKIDGPSISIEFR